MLLSLRIRNLAIVDDAQVEFGPGLNVITGETGAGKSLLIGALNLVLGMRADKSLIRAGADSCSVEATFELASATEINSLLDTLGLAPCDGGQLIVRRQFTAAGVSKCFLNDSSATAQALQRVGDLLVDMHGPHDHQSLFRREFQLDLLDSFSHLDKPRGACEAAYRSWHDLQDQRAALDAGGGDVTQQIDFLKFQIQEIEAAHLDGLDEDALLAEHTRAANAQRILELAGAVRGALSEDDASAFQALAAAQRHLVDLGKIVPEAAAWKQEAANAAGQLQELARAVSDFAGKIDADPARLQALEEQMSSLHRLKRKHGGGLKEILEFLAQSRQRLTDLETRGERAGKLDAEIRQAFASVQAKGSELSALRKTAAKKLAAAATRELRALGFPHGSFDVCLSAAEPGPGGIDAIEFGFAPNIGEPSRPLRAIASSGEISRVMLALKVVLAEHDRIPVLVFDEVDANVGGEMGNAIGEKLRAVADKRQVLCITHLPQVATRGDRHSVVTKSVREGRASTRIVDVDGKHRVEEIARMLGGRDLTSVTMRHAKEMLENVAK